MFYPEPVASAERKPLNSTGFFRSSGREYSQVPTLVEFGWVIVLGRLPLLEQT